jgi:electron transfer flavoprotein beta subunit
LDSLYEYRLPNIIKAKTKIITTYTAEELGVDTTNQLEMLKVKEPLKRKGGLKVESVDEFITKLKEAGAL